MSQTATANGVSIHYVEMGSGPETIVFSHGYLMSHRMFDDQVAALAPNARIIAFDHRCHGKSETVREPFGMYDLVEDAAALIRQTCDGPVHFAGMSTGGFVGMRLALRHPDLIKSLTLIDTSADYEDPKTLRGNRLMLTILGIFGFRPVLEKAMSILMGAPFLNDPKRQERVAFWRDYIGSLDAKSIKAFGQAIFSRDSVVETLAQAQEFPPTLIIVGEIDKPTPVEKSMQMHEAINGSELVIVPNAGHTSPIEEPQAVSEAMLAFYKRIGAIG